MIKGEGIANDVEVDPFTSVPSKKALERMVKLERTPLFYCDWLSALFIHFEIDPAVLQPHVPFTLDCRDGRGYVSLVAFTMTRLRPVFGGRTGAWLCAPIAEHGFLNVRTYVVQNDEPGIYFITEWLPNALSVLLGPLVFGLPYSYGDLEYNHEGGTFRDRVTPFRGRDCLRYSGSVQTNAELQPCRAGTLDEFLLERYTAYTRRGRTPLFFRIWHQPWPQARAQITLEETSLLAKACPWFERARQIGANFSTGARDVWVGFPRRVRQAQKGEDHGQQSRFQTRPAAALV